MNFLQKWILGKTLVKALQTNTRYRIEQGTIVVPSDSKQSYLDNGYSLNEIVYSVVQLILDKIRVAPWGLYKVVDDSSLKQYNGLIKKKNLSGDDLRKAYRLRNKALEPLTSFGLQTGKLDDLMKFPNEQETWGDFIGGGCLFKLVTGDKFIWADLLGGGANKNIPNSLWTLPSQHMIIKATGDFPARIGSYEMTTFGQRFNVSQVLHEKYFNPNWNIVGEQLYGVSPLKAAVQGVLNRNNSAKKASASKFQNGGLDEIIFMDDQRYSAEEGLAQAQALKLKLAAEYSGPSNYGKRAISGVKVGSVPLGLSPVELGIIESEKWDLALICNLYGVPAQLMNSEKSSTYNNVKEAEKSLTNRAALPELISFRDQFNRKLQTDWGFKGQNVYADFDPTVYTELQEDVSSIADWTSKMIAITPNEQRDLIGLEMLEDETMDEPWVLNNQRTPISDYQQNQIDQVLNNEQQRNQANGNEDVPKN